MAEEKTEGLEGLDDFDDDFGEQLESFMENEGEEESDSELDSFFEDLSTIDDLDGDDESEDKSTKSEEKKIEEQKEKKVVSSKPEVHEDTHLEDEIGHTNENFEDNETKKTKKVFPLKGVIISCITGLLFGTFSLLMIYFINKSDEKTLPEIALKKTIEKNKVAEINKPKPKPKKIKPKKIKPKKIKPKPKKITYNIQVVSCISNECLEESRLILKNLGYDSNISISNRSSGIAEVLSSSELAEEKSVKIIHKIS